MLKLLLSFLGLLFGRKLATPAEVLELSERCEKLQAQNESLEEWAHGLQKQHQTKELQLNEEYRSKVQSLQEAMERLKNQLEVQKFRASQLSVGSEIELQKHLSENNALLNQLNWLSGTIAHDFRAPLRAIDANCFFLQDDLGDNGPPDAARTLSEIKRNGQRMGVLIDGLLDYLRVGIAPLNMVRKDLRQVIDSVIDEDFSLLQYPIEVEGEFRKGLLADGELLERMFKELIDNAVKFSASSEIHPRVLVRGLSGNRIEIIDTGVGFKKEHTDQLFQLFHRLHGNDEFPGEGIGLCVAQRIALRHNADITLERLNDRTVAAIHFREGLGEDQTILDSNSNNPTD